MPNFLDGYSTLAEFSRAWGFTPRAVKLHMEQGYCKWPRRLVSGRRGHHLDSLYTNIKNRCYNPKYNKYHRYGGRGIRMCQAWVISFEQFVRDIEALGPKPEGYSLDRINNDGNYEPGNVRWASPVEQVHNSTVCGSVPGLSYRVGRQTWRVQVMRKGVRTRYESYLYTDALTFLQEVLDEA